MRKYFFSLLFALVLVALSPLFTASKAYADCDNPQGSLIPSNNIPYTTATKFSAEFKLDNCNDATVILLIKEKKTNSDKQVTLTKTDDGTYKNNSFQFQNDSDYEAYAMHTGTLKPKPLATVIGFTIGVPAGPTVTPGGPTPTTDPDAGKKVCGSEVSNALECRKECPIGTPTGNGLFTCTAPVPTLTPSLTPPPPTPPCADKPTSTTPQPCKSFGISGFGDPIPTDPFEFIKRLFAILLGLAGGIAMVIILISGYQLMTSQGSKEGVQGAKDRITSAIVGLLFLVFSMVILQVIGVDILSIPGFSK